MTFQAKYGIQNSSYRDTLCLWTYKVTVHAISLFCQSYMRHFKHKPSNKCCCANLTCYICNHPTIKYSWKHVHKTLTLCSEYFRYVHRKHKIKWPICRILSATQTKSHSTHFKVESFKNSPVCFLMLLVWAFQFYCGNTLRHWQVKRDQPHKPAACICLHSCKHTVLAWVKHEMLPKGPHAQSQRRRLKRLPLPQPPVGPRHAALALPYSHSRNPGFR